jgi:hypothetical protein
MMKLRARMLGNLMRFMRSRILWGLTANIFNDGNGGG